MRKRNKKIAKIKPEKQKKLKRLRKNRHIEMVETFPEGLTEAEAARRAANGLSNKVREDNGKSGWRIFKENFLTFFNLINLLLAICLMLVGSFRNMSFLIIVTINAVIGTVQELRARKTIRKLKLLNAPLVWVLRDGQRRKIPAEQLVKGDLILLYSGDQVPADAIVTDGLGAANESLLTGESDAVLKRAGDSLLSGSYISEGRFTARLVKVGSESYAARLTESAKKIKRPKSELMAELNHLIHIISMILVPVGVLLFLKQFYLDEMLIEEAVPKSVAGVIGMIPEGLVLLTSIAMALGVTRLGQKQTLVQELSGIETLARADVLCLDKTGTLTSGRMKLEKLEAIDTDKDTLHQALRRFLSAFDDDTGTLNALRAGIGKIPEADGIIGVLPFSSKRKKSAVYFADGSTLILGAPNFVLPEEQFERLNPTIQQAAEQGNRILVLVASQGMLQDDEKPKISSVLGLCLIMDELRPNVKETMQYFINEGVCLKIISGDDPRTVSAIAGRAGVPNSESFVDATKLDTPEKLQEAADRYTVFGRVTPEQKKLLVKALKAAGHNVAMTGDGVNDIPALKVADCSIAMAGGSDAARHVAQLTLLTSDFSAMPEIVAQGRKVIANITRSSTLFLTKTLYSLLLSLLVLMTFFLHLKYPFFPIQLSMIGGLFIGFPSFVLGLEPNHERTKGKFLRTVFVKAAPGAVAVTVCALLAMFCENMGFSMELCATLATYSTAFVSLLTLLRVAWPLNLLRGLLVLAVCTGMMLVVMLMGDFFYLVPVTGNAIWVLISLCICGGTITGISLIVTRFVHRRKI